MNLGHDAGNPSACPPGLLYANDMELTLTPELQRFLDERIKSGRFSGPEEVVQAGLISLMQQEQVESFSTDEMEAIYPGFRQQIALGIADLDAGRARDGDEVFDQLDREEEEFERKLA